MRRRGRRSRRARAPPAEERAGQVANLRRDGADADLARSFGHGESRPCRRRSCGHRHRCEGEQRDGRRRRAMPHTRPRAGSGVSPARPGRSLFSVRARGASADDGNRNDAERKSRAGGRETVLPGEERAAVDERARPCGIRHQLADGPATPLRQPEEPAQRRPFAAERGVRRARGDGQQRDERGAAAARGTRAPVHSATTPMSGIPAIQAAGGPARARATTRVRSSGAPTPPSRRSLPRAVAIPAHIGTWATASSANEGAAALATEPRASEHASHGEERAGRESDESASGEERDDRSASGAATIRSCSGRGDRDPEVVGHVAQDRARARARRLAREEREEEDEGWRRAHAELLLARAGTAPGPTASAMPETFVTPGGQCDAAARVRPAENRTGLYTRRP